MVISLRRKGFFSEILMDILSLQYHIIITDILPVRIEYTVLFHINAPIGEGSSIPRLIDLTVKMFHNCPGQVRSAAPPK